MRIELDTDALSDNTKGEALRHYVFVDKDEYGHWVHGCYSTFETRPGFVEIDPDKYPALKSLIGYEDDPSIKKYAFEDDKVVCMWLWDGDGTLLVYIKGEKTVLVNTDCKSVYEWEQYEL